MIIIKSRVDLRAWARKSAGLDSGDAQTLVDAIYLDSARPRYGVDWAEYLAGIDVTNTVLHREVRLS
jgi:hypothetical protein